MNKSNRPNTIDPQILFGLVQHMKRSVGFRVAPGGRAEICDAPGIGLLASLDSFVWTALATEHSPFHVRGKTYLRQVREWDANGQQRDALLPTTVVATRPNPSFSGSDHLVSLLFSIKDCRLTHPSAKQLLYPPHLQLLRDVFFDHPISRGRQRNLKELVDDTGLSVAENCNDLVDRFRQAMRDRKWLRRERYNWNLGSQENLMRLHAYLDGLFAQHSSLTVLHLRLLCAPAAEGDHRPDLQILRDCRTKLFDRMRRNLALFSSKPGYVWAILPSVDGRFDLHLTLLFDTAALHKLLDDKRMEADLAGTVPKDHADLIGTYWVEDVTEGQGRYYRADRMGVLYAQDWVHGEVRADPHTERRDRLKRTLGYLAMRRALVRFSNEPAGEYFGMRERKARSPRRPPRGEAKAG